MSNNQSTIPVTPSATPTDLLLNSPLEYSKSIAENAIALEDKDLQDELMDDFRANFEEKAFGIKRDSTGLPIDSPTSSKTSKMKTEHEWKTMVYILSHWNGGDQGCPEKLFRQKYYKSHKNWKDFRVKINSDGTKHLFKIVIGLEKGLSTRAWCLTYFWRNTGAFPT